MSDVDSSPDIHKHSGRLFSVDQYERAQHRQRQILKNEHNQFICKIFKSDKMQLLTVEYRRSPLVVWTHYRFIIKHNVVHASNVRFAAKQCHCFSRAELDRDIGSIGCSSAFVHICPSRKLFSTIFPRLGTPQKDHRYKFSVPLSLGEGAPSKCRLIDWLTESTQNFILHVQREILGPSSRNRDIIVWSRWSDILQTTKSLHY